METHTALLRVAVVEDDPRYRATLEKFFSSTEGFQLAASFGSAVAALETVEHARSRSDPPAWDVLLMDLELPGLDGISAMRRFKALCPDLPIVALTVFEDPATILEAICAGADGYLLKRTTAPELRSQLHSIIKEGAALTPGVARTLMSFVRETRLPAVPRGSHRPPTRLDLTEREQDVLKCIVRGMTYKEAAEALGISLDTVRTHIRNTYRKMQVHSVAEAVSQAIRQRLI